MKKQLIVKFLRAVQIWRDLVIALRNAQKRGDNRAKSSLMRSMFKFRKLAEYLKLQLDKLLFNKKSEV